MTPATALLPCPFCGGEPERDTMHSYRSLHRGSLGTAAAIYCTACDAHMLRCYEDHPGELREDVMADLAETWNRRAALAAPAEVRDTMKVAELHGYLDDWMNLLGTGINGHQAEATMLVDHALKQLVEMRQARKPNADVIALILHEDAMAEGGRLTNGDYLAVKIADTFDPPLATPPAAAEPGP